MRIRFKMTVGEIIRQLEEFYMNNVDERLESKDWDEDDAATVWAEIHDTNLQPTDEVELEGWVESFNGGEHFGYPKHASVEVGSIREVFPNEYVNTNNWLFVPHTAIKEVLK